MRDREANASFTRSPAAGMARAVNRLVSPDHAIGRSLLAARMQLQMWAWRPTTADDRALRTAIATLAPAFTMMDLSRLRRLAELAECVHRDRVPGAVVECGTWRGGSLALIDWALRRRGDARPLWAFDSFEGLPQPGSRDPLEARSGFFPGWCAASAEDVRRALAAVGSDSELHVEAGWLDASLPRAATGPVALLNVDVDWYESVRTALASCWDRVSPGGIVNVDDYGRWRGCNLAVHEFLEAHGLSRAVLRRTGTQGVWLRKP